MHLTGGAKHFMVDKKRRSIAQKRLALTDIRALKLSAGDVNHEGENANTFFDKRRTSSTQ